MSQRRSEVSSSLSGKDPRLGWCVIARKLGATPISVRLVEGAKEVQTRARRRAARSRGCAARASGGGCDASW
jgi:hypothetical protein